MSSEKGRISIAREQMRPLTGCAIQSSQHWNSTHSNNKKKKDSADCIYVFVHTSKYLTIRIEEEKAMTVKVMGHERVMGTWVELEGGKGESDVLMYKCKCIKIKIL